MQLLMAEILSMFRLLQVSNYYLTIANLNKNTTAVYLELPNKAPGKR